MKNVSQDKKKSQSPSHRGTLSNKHQISAGAKFVFVSIPFSSGNTFQHRPHNHDPAGTRPSQSPSHRGTLSNPVLSGTNPAGTPNCLNPLLIGEHFLTLVQISPSGSAFYTPFFRHLRKKNVFLSLHAFSIMPAKSRQAIECKGHFQLPAPMPQEWCNQPIAPDD